MVKAQLRLECLEARWRIYVYYCIYIYIHVYTYKYITVYIYVYIHNICEIPPKLAPSARQLDVGGGCLYAYIPWKSRMNHRRILVREQIYMFVGFWRVFM
jgi:hypothetical protein